MYVALLGKNIQHSLSPQIWRSLNEQIHFLLLDLDIQRRDHLLIIENQLICTPEQLLELIFSLDEKCWALGQCRSTKILTSSSDGAWEQNSNLLSTRDNKLNRDLFPPRGLDILMITSPYKSLLVDIDLRREWKEASTFAINFIYRKDHLYYAGNSDYQAIDSLLDAFLRGRYPVVFGDGVMAQVVSLLLQKREQPFTSIARKSWGNIDKLDLLAWHNEQGIEQPLLVINCCSREFIFQGRIKSDSLFWDLNYQHEHARIVQCEYIDGLNILTKQAALVYQKFCSTG